MKIKLLQIREAKGLYFHNAVDVVDSMREEAKADRECLWVIHANTRNRIIEKEMVSMGALDGSFTQMREVFRKAVINSTAAVVLVHNHPSGSIMPSEADRTFTRSFSDAGRLLGIRTLDHIILGEEGRFYSFNQHGEI